MPINKSITPYPLPIYRYPEFHKNYTLDCRSFCRGVSPARNYDKGWQKGKGREIEGEKEVLFEDGCIIGFDTEYQNLEEVLEAYSGEVNVTDNVEKRNLCLSYQFNAKWKGKEWSGIGYPSNGKRISLAEFLSWVVSTSPHNTDGKVVCPNQFIIVCHFSRADLPSFTDFFNKKFRNLLMAIRKTFVTKTKGAPITIPLRVNGRVKKVKLCIRDTMLLAPSNAKRLEDIGEIIGIPKVKAVTKAHKQNMVGLIKSDFELFEEYALKDAEIARKFAEEVIEISKAKGGKPQIPITLTTLGISFVKSVWKENGYNANAINGKNPERKRRYHTQKKKWAFFNDPSVQNPVRHIFDAFATECYHGGRNEQFIFGAGLPGVWTDYDLASAYPTGMSRIGLPMWSQFETTTNVDELLKYELTFAMVKFKHPDHIRFPVFPVNQEGSVAFPKEGVSFCCGPEISAAKNLGITMELQLGLMIPTDNEIKPYFDYITYCIERRNQYEKANVFNSLWKELANSMYGKLAQGLTKRSGYNIATMEYETLPPSAITNPFFAAYTTSFCRGALAEILNSLPPSVTVCSCTTDGFLSNASDDEIAKATKGPLCRAYLESGKRLRDDLEHPLEIKARIAQPLGWRTRGQATLEPLSDGKIILAKSSFKPDVETKDEQNEWIVNEFANRYYGKVYQFNTLVGVREMIEKEADLYNFDSNKRLSMDYDWKRAPNMSSVTTRSIRGVEHLYFETLPWVNVDQYAFVKNYWKEYAMEKQLVLKEARQLEEFRQHYTERMEAPRRKGHNLSKTNTAVKEFKKWFAKAYRNHSFGLPRKADGDYLSYRKLDRKLAAVGFDRMLHALSNHGGKGADIPNVVPKTDFLVGVVKVLKHFFPNFETDKVFVGGGEIGSQALVVADQRKIDKEVVERLELAQLMRAARSSSSMLEDDVSSSPNSLTAEDIYILLDRSSE